MTQPNDSGVAHEPTTSSFGVTSPQPDTQDAEQDGQHNGHSEYRSPEGHEVSEVEVDQDEDDVELEDVSLDRQNRGIFSWRDVALVYQFAKEYGRNDETFRDCFQDLVGSFGDPIDVAQGLYPPGGITFGTDFIESLIDGAGEGASPSEAMRHGIRLAAELGDMDVEDARAISKMINSLLAYYAEDSEGLVNIRYRRNMPTDEVLSLFMEGIENISKEGVRSFKQAQSLLQIWPLGNV